MISLIDLAAFGSAISQPRNFLSILCTNLTTNHEARRANTRLAQFDVDANDLSICAIKLPALYAIFLVPNRQNFDSTNLVSIDTAKWAHSSGGEHLLDMQEVPGSIPGAPTKIQCKCDSALTIQFRFF